MNKDSWKEKVKDKQKYKQVKKRRNKIAFHSHSQFRNIVLHSSQAIPIFDKKVGGRQIINQKIPGKNDMEEGIGLGGRG